MKTKTLLFLIAAALLAAGVQKSPAGTVPAGTILIVRTSSSASSVDVPGRPFAAKLAKSVTIGGKVAIPAGTHLSGTIVTSRRLTRSNDQLTVNFTSLHLAGRDVPITTSGPQVLRNDIMTRNNVAVSRANYTVPSGMLMQFKLARPLVF